MERPDLWKDPICRWQHRHYLPISIAVNVTLVGLLGWLGHPALEVQVEKAVAACLHSDTVSAELGGSFSTSEVGDAILRELDKLN